MKPDQVCEVSASLQKAFDTNDEEGIQSISLQLLCGVALNLARIAERLDPPKG
jgi:hypothetical protein